MSKKNFQKASEKLLKKIELSFNDKKARKEVLTIFNKNNWSEMGSIKTSQEWEKAVHLYMSRK